MRSKAELKAFLEERQTGIGGSDIGAICGLSKWGSPYSVYMSKVTPVDQLMQEDIGEPAYWGNRLEPIVLEEFALSMERDVKINLPMLRSPLANESYLIAHLDGAVVDTDGQYLEVVEAKTCGAFAARKFGPEGTGAIPEAYILQAQHNMFVSGLDLCHVPVLMGGQHFAYYVVERNDGLMDDARKVAHNLWRRVELKDPPPIDGLERTGDLLKRLHPADDPGSVKELLAGDSLLPIIEELRIARDVFDNAKLSKDALTNAVKSEIEKFSRLEWSGGYITWRKAKDSTKIDWKAIALSMGSVPEELVAEHSTKKTGSRRFLTNWTGVK